MGAWFMASCRSRLVFAKGQAFMELLSFLMVKMHEAFGGEFHVLLARNSSC